MTLDLLHALMVAAAAAAQQPADASAVDSPANGTEVLVLAAGASIELMIVREVDSDRAKPGDPVRLRVNRPVMVGPTVVVPTGTEAHGEVTAISSSGGLLKSGRLAVNITSITLGDRSIPLDTVLEQRARGGKADDFLKVALAPMWLPFSRGNSAKLKAGELLSVPVDERICFAAEGAGYRPVPCAGDEPTIEPATTGS